MERMFAKISHRKLSPALRAKKDELAHSLVGLRKKTIEAAKAKQALYPLMEKQKDIVLGTVRDLSRDLMAKHCLNPQEIIGYEAGSYAKATCIIGSDLDLNVAYNDKAFQKFYPFERELIKTLSWMLQLRPGEVHNNELNMSTQGFNPIIKPPEEVLEQRKFTRQLVLTMVKQMRKTGRVIILGKDMNEFVSWIALRDPRLISASGIGAVRAFQNGNARTGFFLDKVFIFGNEQRYHRILSEIQSEIDLDKIKRNLPALLDRLASSPYRPLASQPASLNQCKTFKELQPFIKHGGYKLGLQLLFMLGIATTNRAPEIPRQFSHFLGSDMISQFLGKNLRDELFYSLDWLMKVRAVVSVYANGGIENPSIGLASLSPDYSKMTLEQVLDVLNLNSLANLKETLKENREVILKSVTAARENIIT
jgi:hypothetical protein